MNRLIHATSNRNIIISNNLVFNINKCNKKKYVVQRSKHIVRFIRNRKDVKILEDAIVIRLHEANRVNGE